MKIKTIRAVHHIVSEPGDATLYDYFVYEDYDEFSFMPCKSTFKFPQRLNYWDIKDINSIQDLIGDSDPDMDVNPHTIMECIRTIKELRNEKI